MISHEHVERDEILLTVGQLMPLRPLTEHEAEYVAERQAGLLRFLLDLDATPADLDPIVALPNLEVRVARNLPVSGFSEWNRQRWLIALRDGDSYPRRRFTLAHEIKHVLDDPYIDTIYPDSDGEPSPERAEATCDHFAACLLMPRPAVKEMFYAGNQHIEDLAGHFAVGPSAMRRRLHHIGLIATEARCGTTHTGTPTGPSQTTPTAQGSEPCP